VDGVDTLLVIALRAVLPKKSAMRIVALFQQKGSSIKLNVIPELCDNSVAREAVGA
jgi:hypothetical protein